MSHSGGQSSATASESQHLYAATDAFGHALSGRVADWDRDQALDRQAFVEAAAIGLTGVEVPKYLGGLGLGFHQKVKAAEILGRHSMAFAFSVINTHNVAARLAEAGSPSHKRDLLPELLSGRRIGSTALTEPAAGSDFGAITTHGQRHGSGWVLNGEKAWITNASVSDIIICYVQTDPDAGSKGIASFLIDGKRPGFERLPPYRLNGSHLIGTGGFRLTNYRAETEDLLTEPGDGFRTALASVNGARVYVAALCCSMVHASLVTATQYGSNRSTFGKTLLEHQGLAWSLAAVANKLEAARLLTDRAIGLITSGDTDEVILAAAHAKKFATEMAEPAIIACIQAMGAEGLRDHYPLGRHLADARVANFVDGSTEIQTERIARSLAKIYKHETFEAPPEQKPPVPEPTADRTDQPPPPQSFPPPPVPATAFQPAPSPVDHNGWQPPPPDPRVDEGKTLIGAAAAENPAVTEDQAVIGAATIEDPAVPEDAVVTQDAVIFQDVDADEPVDQKPALTAPAAADPEYPAVSEETIERPAGGWFDTAPPETAEVEEVIDSPPPMPPGGPPLPPDSLRTENI